MPKASNLDAHSINARLLKQVSRVLDDLEGEAAIGPKERIMALLAIGRLQVLFVAMRKAGGDHDNAGRSVRKYASAFKTHANASGRRKGAARPAHTPDDLDDLDDDSDSAA